MIQTIKHIYDKKYKQLFIITVLLLMFSIFYLGYKYAITGSIIEKGVSLKGGIILTIQQENANIEEIQTKLKQAFPKAETSVRSITTNGKVTSITIETEDIPDQQLNQELSKIGINLENTNNSREHIGSALGESFFRQTIIALLLAFIAMSIVVYFTFRSLAPALFISLTAASDIITTIAIMSFLELKITTASIAALLMLIGYSVDTDILLTNRVLNRTNGTVFERIIGALKTGVTMTIAGLAAVIAGYIFSESEVVKQIMLILMIGNICDLFYTWIQNAGILRWYLEQNAPKN